MKSHSENAAIASLFTYSQFGLALISGIVLLPMIIHSVGTYHYGLWLATGEATTYILLNDFGVFAVLPWLVSGCIGAKDFDCLRQHFSNAIAIGFGIGLFLLLACIVIRYLNPLHVGIPPVMWNEVVYPMIILLTLNGLGYPLRAFHALIVGAQDVFFAGSLSIIQSVLTVALTILMILSESGIAGLAFATGFPPLFVGLLAGIRVVSNHPYALKGVHHPNFAGCRKLFQEGFGAWLGGLGFRLMVASNGIILAGAGRPDWATIYASTGKIAQVLTPICSTVPDSALVGISQVYASNKPDQIRRSIVCLILLYTVLPSFAAIAILVGNPAFVRWWIGSPLYAGDYINALTALSIIVAGLTGGLMKLASVVGWRQTVGWSTLAAGLFYAVSGYLLVRWRGLAGLAEATLITCLFIVLPIGIVLVSRIYGLRLYDFTAVGLRRWFVVTLTMIVLAFFLGASLVRFPTWAFGASFIAIALYGLLLRPVLALPPWPVKVRYWLTRFRVIPYV